MINKQYNLYNIIIIKNIKYQALQSLQILLRLYCKPYNLKKLLKIEDPSQPISSLVKEASDAFNIPEAAVVISVNQLKVDLNQSINQYCQNGQVVTIDIDSSNLKQKQMELDEQKLQKEMDQNVNIESLFNFLAQNAGPVLIKKYILASQEKLQYAGKIVAFTKQLERQEFTQLLNQGDEQAMSGKIISQDKVKNQLELAEKEIKDDLQMDQYYPNSYLSFNKATQDQYLQIHEDMRQAKLDLSSTQGLPVALTQMQVMKPTRYRETDDDTYELDQLQAKNINTVLIENLFVEVAVMYKFTTIIKKTIMERNGHFDSWQEQDQAEDVLQLHNDSQFILIELLNVKDMLLGQYLLKQKKIDEMAARKGQKAYMETLEKVYQNEFQQVVELMDGVEFDREEALQALEQFNGNVNQTLEFIKK